MSGTSSLPLLSDNAGRDKVGSSIGFGTVQCLEGVDLSKKTIVKDNGQGL